MSVVSFTALETPTARLWPVIASIVAIVVAGLAAFLIIETQGHHVTGMTQRITWGVPHVFAYFLILAASGALNVAMLAAVFGRTSYKPLEPFSTMLAIALLMGGLSVLVLDLGRPDRVLLTIQYRNNWSIFAWNTVLYTGFLTLAALHLATLLNRRYARFNPISGHAANLWRFALTTGTGLDLGVLVARELYRSAMFAPLFISYSLTYGLAVLLVLLPAVAWLGGGRREDAVEQRLGRLLAIFVAISFYFTLVLHAFNLYAPDGRALTRFLWFDGGVYTALIWGGQVLLATVAPLLLIARKQPIAAAATVVVGGLATIYVFLIAAQAVAQPILPGRTISSPFGDGTVASYVPTWTEWLLGLGGVGMALLVLLGACLIFRIVPVRQVEAAPRLSAEAA